MPPRSAAPRLPLHHVGFVVDSIDRRAERFAASISGSWNGRIVDDPIQEVRVTFIKQACDGQPLIELVEPVGLTSRAGAFLRRGGGLHHLCYEAESIEEELAASRAQGDRVLQQPVPAAAFGGRRIAWVFTRDNLLIEYLEREKPAGQS